MDYDLSMEETRALGALMEKETTTPDYYPLTLNALVNACNQKSNREPVVSLTESQVLRAIDSLRERQFAWSVRSAESRVEKYEENLSKKLDLTLQETAVLCVLMLRGAQTLGELRARANRIYPFESMGEVAVALDTLGEHERGAMVVKLPLQQGRKEARYAHLLSGEPEIPPEPVGVLATAEEASDPDHQRLQELEGQVARLREELRQLREELQAFKGQFE